MRSSCRRFVPGVLLFCCLCIRLWGAEPEYVIIPFDVDPPITIDGDLADWSDVPNLLILEGGREDCVFYNEATWTGPADLGGRMRLAWRRNGLFVAAEVTDDIHSQSLTGPAFFRGDHVVIWMDMIPGEEPQRTRFGRGQFQFGLSPGDFQDTPAAIHVWRPADTVQQGGEIASRRTADGYLIEAFVPFSRLQVGEVDFNTDANFAVGISDCDQTQPVQETMLVRGQGRWSNSRDNLLPLLFGDGNAQGTPPARGIPIAAAAEIPALGQATFTFTSAALAEGKVPYIYFKGRMDAPRVAGYCNRSLQVSLNGRVLGRERLANKPVQGIMARGGAVRLVYSDDSITLPYTPTFGREINWHHLYGLIDRVPADEWEFRVDGLLRAGDNELVLTNLKEATETRAMTVHLADLDLRIRNRPVPPKPRAAAPTGELPLVEPRLTFPQTYSGLQAAGNGLRFAVNGEDIQVGARFTTPDGTWQEGPNPFFDVQVKRQEEDEWIILTYTFTNRTDQWLPIMQEYTCSTASAPREIWLAGLKIAGATGRASLEANPSAVAVTERAAVALLALNDEFHVHVSQFARDGVIGLSDHEFVLSPGGTYSAELAVVPAAEADFYAALNASRRLLDVNFPIRYMFAFVGTDALSRARGPWTEAMLRQFVENKSANLLSTTVRFSHQGRRPHGVAFRLPEYAQYHDQYRAFHRQLRELFPGIAIQVYYHSYLDVTDDGPEVFADCRALNAAGEQMDYSKKGLWLYTPTLENAWGKATAKNVDFILDDLGADGVYWDEFNRSRAKYVYNMLDHCSADIDPAGFTLARRKGAVALLSRDFAKAMAEKIMARGPLVTNGAPHTRTLAQLKYQCFTETGSLDNCRRVLLYTPVALGDHLTEHSLEDAYRVMLGALDRGCLYSWYSASVVPQHKTLTEHMFPFTPIELHSGYVIGKERILTNRSGRFGWGDASAARVYVYDHRGRQTDTVVPQTVVRDGKVYTDIRLPEGYSAALVREPPAQP